jgi:hypothetical protein
MADVGFEWSLAVERHSGLKACASAIVLTLATTVAGAIVFVPAPHGAPAETPLPSPPPTLDKKPQDSLEPTWGKTQFAELGPGGGLWS